MILSGGFLDDVVARAGVLRRPLGRSGPAWRVSAAWPSRTRLQHDRVGVGVAGELVAWRRVPAQARHIIVAIVLALAGLLLAAIPGGSARAPWPRSSSAPPGPPADHRPSSKIQGEISCPSASARRPPAMRDGAFFVPCPS